MVGEQPNHAAVLSQAFVVFIYDYVRRNDVLCCKVSICLLDHFVPCLPFLPPGIPAMGGVISRRTTEQSTGESVFIHRLLDRCTGTHAAHVTSSLSSRNSNEQMDY